VIQIQTFRETPRILPLYARAAAALIPAASELRPLPGNGGGIPAQHYRQFPVTVDLGMLAAYNDLCGFPDSRHLPSTYPHVLAFPLHLALLTNGAFPYPPVGLIHIENQIEQRARIPVGEQLHISVYAERAKPHPRGLAFTLITEVRVSREQVWHSASTMLYRGRKGRRGGSRGEGGQVQDAATAAHAATASAGEWPAQDSWALPRNLGRSYARNSRDRNPIHTIPLAARLLGYDGPIAHGMWTKARAIAALGEQPDRHRIEVSFHKPIVLPATVKLTRRENGQETEFAVRDTEKHASHLRGRIWQPSLETTPRANRRAHA
jgi:acyl dehydratase